jgi:hypothetical protein
MSSQVQALVPLHVTRVTGSTHDRPVQQVLA